MKNKEVIFMRFDPFADALTHIKNSDFVAKKSCTVMPASKLLVNTLKILLDEKYIAGYELKTKANMKTAVIKLNGMLTNLRAIKPRFAVSYLNLEKFEKRYLPSRNVGLLILSTPKGLKTHVVAKREKIGGRLLAYVY